MVSSFQPLFTTVPTGQVDGYVVPPPTEAQANLELKKPTLSRLGTKILRLDIVLL